MNSYSIPNELFELSRLFKKAGFCLYAVGGMTRNPLLGLPVSDIDVTSAMTPEDVIRLCEREGIKNVPKGIDFGTVEIHIQDEERKLSVEHTTFRSDVYGGGGAHRPQAVRFTDDLAQDAFRRDFSVNAIYRDIETGDVIDPTGGMKDIEKRLIRATSSDPSVILRDDGLRIMRMARFACQLGFDVEEGTFNAAREHVGLLRDISAERIRDEFDKILLSDMRYPDRDESFEPVLTGLNMLDEVGAVTVLFPELEVCRGVEQNTPYHRYDVLQHLYHTAAAAPGRLFMRLAGLFHDVGKPIALKRSGKMYGHDDIGVVIAREIFLRLKYPRRIQEEALFIIQNHMYDLKNTAKETTLRAHFAKLGYERSVWLARFRQADVTGSGVKKRADESAMRWLKLLETMKREGAPFSLAELKCSGEDVMRWLDMPASPEIGEIKRRLLAHCARIPKDNRLDRLEFVAKGMRPKR